jgi:hypothetical protein
MRRIRRPSHATVVAYVALFIAIGGGTAFALDGANTVFTDDIANDTQPAGGGNPAGGLQAADLRAGSVASSEAANNSLTGADVNEATLNVDSATSVLGSGCAPNSTAFISCGFGNFTFRKHGSGESDALVLITVKWSADVSGAAGNCRLLVDGVVQSSFAIGETTDTTNATHPAYATRPFSVEGEDGQSRNLTLQCNETEQDFVIHDSFLAVTGDLQD